MAYKNETKKEKPKRLKFERVGLGAEYFRYPHEFSDDKDNELE
jgi:hypothetical protein